MPKIKAAKLSKSPRLQRLYAYLRDGHEHTTLDIILNTGLCAISAAISELRENGLNINCRKLDQNRYAYRMEV